MSNYGIVEYFGCNNGSYPCGYCKGIKKDSDFGMWAHTLSNMNYQNLIDRNWRRSGKYCYKPILNQTCCPMYTIRCDALNFKLKKSQKRVIKKFNHFIRTGEKPSKRSESQTHAMDLNVEDIKVKPILDTKGDKSDLKFSVKTEEEEPKTVKTFSENLVVEDINVDKSGDKTIIDGNNENNENNKNNKKAKYIRIERKLNKIMKREKCDQKTAQNIMREAFKQKVIKNDKTKSLEEYLTQIENSDTNRHKLKIRYVLSTDACNDKFEVSHGLYQRYQLSIHGDPKDKCTPKQFRKFLIDSPLENESLPKSYGYPNHLGSYHQQYWLDDRLIAVGVIDILPKCVSSVYLYYEPEFDFLSLGTYSALREIHLVRSLQRFIPELKYYYMGFYIHSCPKMKYKGKFIPSDLLCGETFLWNPIEKCVPKLEISKYCRFEDNMNAIDSDSHSIKDEEIKILYKRDIITFKEYKSLRTIGPNEELEVKQYAKIIGRKCSTTLLLFRS